MHETVQLTKQQHLNTPYKKHDSNHYWEARKRAKVIDCVRSVRSDVMLQ